MAIYKRSRYTKTAMYIRDEVAIFKIREMLDLRRADGIIYEFTEGDTLDGIAYKFYGDSQLWWVLLEANVGYRTPMDIKHGDELFIPAHQEVIKHV